MKLYQGRRLRPGLGTASPVSVTVWDSVTKETRFLVHQVLHSPDGFAWGYYGSGPADLARSILIDATGYDNYYQAFKSKFVAKMGDSWTITEESIAHWLANKKRQFDGGHDGD